jgi:precorrin-2/cobalt-factor-2 C20-methyltransferase
MQESNGRYKLYCIGCGPGDPELLTLKAKRLIESADVIFAPTSRAGKESIALSIVKPIIEQRTIKPEVRELVFPMLKDKDMLKHIWKSNADAIAEECMKGRLTVYLCVGDPSLYSTFSYLHKEFKRYYSNIDIEIVPGIASFTSFASKAKINLVEGEQVMAIVPACYDLERVRSLVSACDTIVFLKDGRYFNDVIRILREHMPDDSYIAIAQDISSEQEVINITKLKDVDTSSISKYFSIMVVKREHA